MFERRTKGIIRVLHKHCPTATDHHHQPPSTAHARTTRTPAKRVGQTLKPEIHIPDPWRSNSSDYVSNSFAPFCIARALILALGLVARMVRKKGKARLVSFSGFFFSLSLDGGPGRLDRTVRIFSPSHRVSHRSHRVSHPGTRRTQSVHADVILHQFAQRDLDGIDRTQLSIFRLL
ncbi:hypothetical protein RSAG8_10264, partial [Rhizoctonia solani AG-8 WAC10335]